MVNDRFRAASIYGFEMVDARMARIFAREWSSIENLRRIESLQFSANFPRLYLNANTSDLSTAVNQGQSCGLTATQP
jgi:hypothetical protein